MASYRVEWRRPAQKELRRLSATVRRRVLTAVEELVATPRPGGARKLVGAERTYRIRVGDYRIVYSILDEVLLIEIIRVGHRRDVYRQLT